MELAKNMITGCDLTPQDIDAVAVAAGPGSFTGVRIGMACAKGFAWGHQLPLYGVSTLEAMVRGAACADGCYCACMDARKGQIYNALFDWTAGTPHRRPRDCNFRVVAGTANDFRPCLSHWRRCEACF